MPEPGVRALSHNSNRKVTMTVTSEYGPWGVVAGGSDGVGVAFARGWPPVASTWCLWRGGRPCLRRPLTTSGRGTASRSARCRWTSAPLVPWRSSSTRPPTWRSGFCFNAGGDDRSAAFLDKDLSTHLELVRRNCASVLEAAYRFGAPMVARGRGALVLVTSGAAWAGGATLATYGATKAFDLILAESLWAEGGGSGVDVLGLVLGRDRYPFLPPGDGR